MQNRRRFLRNSSLIALAPSVPGFLADYASANQPKVDDRVLVVIQMDGGNDGVNTLIPFNDEGYQKNRKTLSIAKDDLIKLDANFGLHPRMRMMADLWEDDLLAIVPAVGYPNPSRSHDFSTAIWQTCAFTAQEHKTHGWLGRSMDQASAHADGAPHSILIGNRQPPIALQGRRSVASSLNNLEDFVLPENLRDQVGRLDEPFENGPEDLTAFVTRKQIETIKMSNRIELITGKRNDSVRYPASRLAGNLKTVSHLLKSGFGTRVFYAVQGGYDTHARQLQSHGNLLRALSSAVNAFMSDLKAAKLDDRVMVLCFSEFGRRVDENGSKGTDHGSAGLTMLIGSGVKAGIHGGYPSLLDLDDGGLKVKTDFRSVYASVLNDWMGLDATPVVGKTIEPLQVVG